jgi:hypothetical protein
MILILVNLRSRLFSLYFITLIVWLLSACGPAPEGTILRDDEVTLAPTPQASISRDQDTEKPFNTALERASSAATLAQSAKTEADWKAVIEQWKQAIALMKTVPKDSSDYAIAQQKISEYQKKLDTALQKTKAATPVNE